MPELIFLGGGAAASLFRQAGPSLRLRHPKNPVCRLTLGELPAQRSAQAKLQLTSHGPPCLRVELFSRVYDRRPARTIAPMVNVPTGRRNWPSSDARTSFSSSRASIRSLALTGSGCVGAYSANQWPVESTAYSPVHNSSGWRFESLPGPTTLRPAGYAWRSRAETRARSVASGIARTKQERRRTVGGGYGSRQAGFAGFPP